VYLDFVYAIVLTVFCLSQSILWKKRFAGYGVVAICIGVGLALLWIAAPQMGLSNPVQIARVVFGLMAIMMLLVRLFMIVISIGAEGDIDGACHKWRAVEIAIVSACWIVMLSSWYLY